MFLLAHCSLRRPCSGSTVLHCSLLMLLGFDCAQTPAEVLPLSRSLFAPVQCQMSPTLIRCSPTQTFLQEADKGEAHALSSCTACMAQLRSPGVLTVARWPPSSWQRRSAENQSVALDDNCISRFVLGQGVQAPVDNHESTK